MRFWDVDVHRDGSATVHIPTEQLGEHSKTSEKELMKRLGSTMTIALMSAFACELAMKAICLTRKDETRKSHDLWELYSDLPEDSRARIEEDFPEAGSVSCGDGPCIGQQEGPVHGQPLGRCDGEDIAVIETDIAVPVADLVVAERYGSPIFGARRYQDTRLRSGLASLNLEVLHRDHGSVEQLLLPVRGADTQPVAACDLERRGCPVVFCAPAYDHRHPVRIGPFSMRQRGEPAFPHQMG